MARRKALTTKFYMVRLEGGEWPPHAKHKTLAEAMKEAARLAKEFQRPATVISSFVRVEVLGDEFRWEDVRPDDGKNSDTSGGRY